MGIDLRSLLDRSWQNAGLTQEHSVLVSVSGGADSMALLGALLLSERRVRVAHVNFGLRGHASDVDEAFVADFCASRGVSFVCRRVTAEERAARTGESVQEWARRVRREWFQSLLQRDEVIALGHHRDDLIETVMMRLLRGASAQNLGGMEEYRAPWWRPFLSVSRQEIRTWLLGQELPHREDESNATLDYSRNVLRNSVIPQLEQLFPGCSNRLLNLSEETRDLAQATRATFPDFSEGIPRDWLRRQSRGAAMTAIASLVENGTFRTLSRSFLALVWDSTKAETSHWATEVPGGGRLELHRDRLIFRDVTPASFAGRSRQHAQGLKECRLRAIVTQGSCAKFSGSDNDYRAETEAKWVEHHAPSS